MRLLAILAWSIALTFECLHIVLTIVINLPLKIFAKWFEALGDKLSKGL